ncbi:MAG: glycosyltransferase [Bacillota bacterium]|nr:glycosyltransferase [Bacillota bacterium]
MISVCMIVKNEENQIKKCLDSVVHFADEILIVDNGCTDRTLEFAKSYECRILDGRNYLIDDARNLYLNNAREPWIFVIDADEICGDVNSTKLKTMLEEADSEIWAFSVQVYEYIGLGKWAEVSMIRIFRNNGKIHYNNSAIHSTLIPSIISQGKKISESNVYLHHMDILLKNRTRNKRVIYRELLKNTLSNSEFQKEDPSSYELYSIFLAMEYVSIENYKKAEELLIPIKDNGIYYKKFALIGYYRLKLLQNKMTEQDCELLYSNIGDGLFGEDLDIVDILINFYVINNEYQKAIDLIIMKSEYMNLRASDYINYSFLLKSIDFEKGKDLLLSAIKCNPFLCNKEIYKDGEKPNIFEQQSNILTSIDSVYALLTYYGLSHLIRKDTYET